MPSSKSGEIDNLLLDFLKLELNVGWNFFTRPFLWKLRNKSLYVFQFFLDFTNSLSCLLRIYAYFYRFFSVRCSLQKKIKFLLSYLLRLKQKTANGNFLHFFSVPVESQILTFSFINFGYILATRALDIECWYPSDYALSLLDRGLNYGEACSQSFRIYWSWHSKISQCKDLVRGRAKIDKIRYAKLWAFFFQYKTSP